MKSNSGLSSQYKSAIAVVGSGYWGRNHVRNFYQLGALSLVCDENPDALKAVAEQYPGIEVVDSFEEALSRPEIRGVVIATPAESHHVLAKRALAAGKDVLVEKPLALNVNDGWDLVNAASQNGAILMVGHILLYHPAVIKLKEIVESGALGKIQYIQSNRLSMGKVRSEENILWSFAPHDISMILYLLDEMPEHVQAFGRAYLQPDVEDVTISHLDFKSGVSAHIYVSWMNPFKEHRLVVIGDRKMAVFEDSRPDKKLRIFNHSFEWVHRQPMPSKGDEEAVAFPNEEPLKQECLHFLECMETRRRPRSDAHEGLRTLQVLQACFETMKRHGHRQPVPVKPPSDEKPDYFVHETAVIDHPCSIGSGTRIWHFSHVMSDAHIGQNCNIGANVLVGKGVVIGNGCKIQNNVSIYEGVTLEDYVFCGPSMVFTNVFNPRSEIPRMKELRPTLVKKGATIGANATIVCGHTIGEYAFIGAGAVVTRDVVPYALMVGNPARRIGWMCRCGTRLPDAFSPTCPACGESYVMDDGERLAPQPNQTPVKHVPLLNLKAQYLSIKTEIDEAIARVLDSQRFIGGPEVEALEKEIAAYCGCEYAVGVSSGTDALLVSLMALGIGPGDEVITTPFTFFATVGSIMRVGATPVFADIDPVTFNIDPEQVKRAVTERTKAIIPVHLFGQCADMDPLLDLAKARGIAIIEDAAQAIGAVYKGRRAGTMGAFGCFSFFPSKNLGGFGDGGMVTTNDPELAEKVRIIRNQGAKPKYHHVMLGGNFRLDALHAAILRVKLKYLDKWTEKRIENAAFYTRRFMEGANGSILTPSIVQDRHIFNQYVIRIKNRDALKSFLKDRGIETEIYYPKPMHLQECLQPYGYPRPLPLSESERAAEEVLALPIFPELSVEQLAYVSQAVIDFVSK
jgi:UDP-2-acetamido-3-amino-2,3-dideoxy-glucuronate N-acetyltransferase